MDVTALRPDDRSDTPSYLQLKDNLVRAIRGGALGPGEALPAERKLAAQLGVARGTVRRALEELVEQGVLERRPGSGTFVRERRMEQIVDRVLGFTDEAAQHGFRPGSIVLEVARIDADSGVDAEVAHALGAAADGAHDGVRALRVTRLRTADGTPLALQIAYLPERFANLSVAALNASGSLYRSLAQQFGATPHRARQRVTARLPTETEQMHLQIDPATPVLALERTTLGADGLPLEFVRSAYRGDRYEMLLELTAPPRPSGAPPG